MNYTVNLLMSQFVTHDVKRFIVSKPAGFSSRPARGWNWRSIGRA